VIVEWLKRRGTFCMPAVDQRKTFRRWIKDNVSIAPRD